MLVAYTRVSTEEQKESGLSLAAQEDRILSYCKLYDIKIAKWECDAGESGSTMNRTGLTNALTALNTQQAGGIIVSRLDRLSRSSHDWQVLLKDYFSQEHQLVSVNEKVDTHTAMGKCMVTVMMAFAQLERDLISERTTDALHKKMEKGELVGNLKYGYTLADDGKTLIKDKFEQGVIAKMISWRESGMKPIAIAKKLNLEEKIRSKKGDWWHPATVATILKREM